MTQSTSFGKVFTYPNNPRVAKAAIAAAYNGGVGEFEQVIVTMGQGNKTPEFLAKFPLGKVPAFEGSDGFCLTESRAIMQYVASQKEGSSLFGKSLKDKALVEQWLSFVDCEINPIVAAWLYPIYGYVPHNEAVASKAKADAAKLMAYLDSYLLSRTFLVGQSVTLADITLVCHILGLYKMVFSPTFRASFLNVNRWFITCVNQPQFKTVLGEVVLATEEAKPPAPVKKEEVKPKAVVAAAEEEEPSYEDEKPKGKNPLDLLPKSTFVLDEWKRFYSNNDTRPTAVNWFWSNFDPAGYSIWKVDYKYNSELTLTFMTSNLVGGFFQRLECMRKYAFGSLLVCGTDNDNIISGYFVIRGHSIPPEMKEVPDYESYNFVKVNDADTKVREAFNGAIAWDVSINGKPFVDGKIFK